MSLQHEATTTKQPLTLSPARLDYTINFTFNCPSAAKTFSLKNNSPHCIRVECVLLHSNSQQIIIFLNEQHIPSTIEIDTGKQIFFKVVFSPKFPGFDRQSVEFKAEGIDPVIIPIKLDCLINMPVEDLLHSVVIPSTLDLIYYIPPSNTMFPQRTRAPMVWKLNPVRYMGTIDDKDSIEMALSSNFERVLSLFASGLLPSLYRRQMDTALRLEHAVSQIAMSVHDIHSLSIDKFDGEYFSVDFPGIIDEDYTIGPGAVEIYLEYYCGAELFLTCLCEYGTIDRENGVVKLRPAKIPYYVPGLSSIVLRIKLSTVPLRFALQAMDVISDHTINNVLFPISVDLSPREDCQAFDMRGKPALTFVNRRLNTRQKEAVCNIVEGRYGRLPFILFGPPGTGKSTTIIEAILQVYSLIPSSVILVTAQTNKSVDLLALHLIDSGVISPQQIIRYSSQMWTEEDMHTNLRPHFRDVVLRNSVGSLRIVCTTFVMSAVFTNASRDGKFFTHLFVDEASQSTESSTVISINLLKDNGRLILAGDPHQLGPMTHLTCESIASVTTNSILHRLIENRLYIKIKHKYPEFGGYNPVLIVKLVENYRNFDQLVHFISSMFYDNELVAKASLEDSQLCHNFGVLRNKSFPLLIHGVKGLDYLQPNVTSFVNIYEAILSTMYIDALIREGIRIEEIAVISFYKKQSMLIKRLLQAKDMEKVDCITIEKFQGSEKTVVILSTVRCMKDHVLSREERLSLKFLFNYKRFNVAVSRAVSMLIVIGDPNVMKQDACWTQLYNYCMENNSYVGCGSS